MTIDYNRILTNDSEIISDDRLQMIKNRAAVEERKFRAKHTIADIALNLHTRADEFAYGTANNDLNADERALLSANIVFPDERMTERLQKGSFDKDTLKRYMDIIAYVKRRLAANDLSGGFENYKSKVENYTRKLVGYFSHQVGLVNANQIINKIYEILTYEPELLETNSKPRGR